MNEYTMDLINDLRAAENKLAKLETRLDVLMALVAKAELENEELNKRIGSTSGARIECDEINAIFGWTNMAKEGEDGETA